jgi:ATP-dependent Lon protease
VPPDILLGVMQQKDCGDLADFIAANISLDFEQKQCILDELHPEKRIAKLNDILSDEIKVLSLEREISQKAQEQMDENQRVYMLREQMRAIASELGEEDNPQEESDEFRQRIEKLNLPQVAREKLLKECDRLAKMPYGSHEGSVMRVYLETCLELPWNTSSKSA